MNVFFFQFWILKKLLWNLNIDQDNFQNLSSHIIFHFGNIDWKMKLFYTMQLSKLITNTIGKSLEKIWSGKFFQIYYLILFFQYGKIGLENKNLLQFNYRNRERYKWIEIYNILTVNLDNLLENNKVNIINVYTQLLFQD